MVAIRHSRGGDTFVLGGDFNVGTNNTTIFGNPIGTALISTVDTNRHMTFPLGFTVTDMIVRIISNTKDVDFVASFRDDSVSVILITITAGVVAEFSSLNNAVSVAPSSLIGFEVNTTGSTAGATQVINMAVCRRF